MTLKAFDSWNKSDFFNLLLALPVGIIAALVTVLFREAISAVNGVMFQDGTDITRAFLEYPRWIWPLITGCGGLVAGALLWQARRVEARQGSAPDYLEVIDRRLPGIPAQGTLWRGLSSLASIASGGSIGREGAMVQLSALSGSLLAQGARLPTVRRGDVIAMAAAGGLAAVYHAPLAGALFVAEIAFGVTAVQRLIPLFIAAAVSVLTVRSLTGDAPLYFYAAATFEPGAGALLTVLLIGVAAGVAGPLFLSIIELARRAFSPIAHPVWRLGLGGVLVGGVAMVSPLVLGNGFEVIDRLLNGGDLATPLLALLLLKVLATALTVGSGAVGGLFTPSLLVGAAAGALVCASLHALGIDPGPMGLYAAIGMSAMLAATSHAPLMSIMMAFEMTLNSSLLFPLMLATAISYVVASCFATAGAYPVLNRHNARFQAKSEFETGTIGPLMNRECSFVVESATAAEAMREGLKQKTRFVYVISGEGRFLGVVSTSDLATGIMEGSLAAEATITPFIIKEFTTVYQDARYEQAWALLSDSPLERLPVLDNAENRHLLGVITKASLLHKAQEFL
ncbi:chloride channel protein [Nissabacter sp. SGAir0207]|uniref:chloride channel protein n=1 Tax=Nissabacter sp. SGAir0207 TaxID=2126321 RepID=UPI0010CD4C12|nr:chloride channel protein [Nissabacter sp. SGAir0207]QCR35880.1 chloride channel protein [Nissabacter sp. SGAir0207]